MEAKRWTLGVVLAAAVSLFGLIQADASPFSTHVLSDDLGNRVNGTAPEQDEWETTDGSGSTTDGSGKDNNGHGNNEDGVDSSNTGSSKDGEDTLCADGTFCDDESGTSSGSGSDTAEETTTTEETKTNNGNGNGKDK